LATLRGDPAQVAAMSSPVDSTMACAEFDAKKRGGTASVFVFTYEVSGLSTIVYYEDDGGLGPFQIWRLSDCADRGTVE
jgi:hypothetical protein